ncbi:hypothetical protein P692DRAFT_20880724 [Suillus brevipes Sb2]|nr:hypothetical protein P692DRAFT_20880724 [Suillus brevipes Sb2]
MRRSSTIRGADFRQDSARAEVDALKTKLKTYADYGEVKREVEILKHAEFAGLDPDDDCSSPDEDEDGMRVPNPNATDNLYLTAIHFLVPSRLLVPFRLLPPCNCYRTKIN